MKAQIAISASAGYMIIGYVTISKYASAMVVIITNIIPTIGVVLFSPIIPRNTTIKVIPSIAPIWKYVPYVPFLRLSICWSNGKSVIVITYLASSNVILSQHLADITSSVAFTKRNADSTSSALTVTFARFEYVWFILASLYSKSHDRSYVSGYVTFKNRLVALMSSLSKNIEKSSVFVMSGDVRFPMGNRNDAVPFQMFPDELVPYNVQEETLNE